MVPALVLAWFHSAANPPGLRSRTLRVACTVLEVEPGQPLGRSAYSCKTDAGPVLSVAGEGRLPLTGRRYLLRGRLEAFDPPRNPGEPDEREIEAERGIDARLSAAAILSTLPPGPLTLDVAIARMHAWALENLRAQLGEPYASILAGELWGARGSLPPGLRAEFQQTGTVHVLVTAGLHLGVVAMVVLAMLRACTAPRAITCALALAAVWSYALLSGLHLPSLRAAVMISCGLLAYGFGAATRSWSAYGLAVAVVALLRPQAVTGASFALSFSCVGAILLCADDLLRALESLALPDRVKEALALTIATQLGTWPLTASIFLLFSPYAMIANLCVVPLVGATMVLGGLELLLTPFPLFAQTAAALNGAVLAWIVSSVQTIATLPYASIPMTPSPWWAIGIYDCALVAAVWCLRKGARTAALALFFFGVTTVLWPPVAPQRTLRITVLDVGQADAIAVQTPLGRTILIDAGGRLERGSGQESTAEQIGERIVVPFLRRGGVRRIDALILSHPHGDHAGGMAPVLRAFGVAEFADGGQQYAGYAYRDAVATARYERVPVVYPRGGMVWRTDDGVTLTFIGPSMPFIESDNTINDNSIAFILQYRRFRMLFTGDAGVAAEQRFLHEGIDLRADVLKVGHHGSAYSSSAAFIASVHPHYAVISVGRHNMFGHPAPSTIETLRHFGARVYRTDQDGAVTITTDGERNKVASMLLPFQ